MDFRQTLSYRFIISFILLTGCLFQLKAQNQSSKIQAKVIVKPVTTPYMEGYVDPTIQNLQAEFFPLTRASEDYNAVLKIDLEGQGIKMRSHPNSPFYAVVLRNNTSTVVSSSAFRSLFEPDNLEYTGIAKEDFMANKIFPEGSYEICIQAFDAKDPDQAISTRGCGRVEFKLLPPPMLILKENGDVIKKKKLNSLDFKWANTWKKWGALDFEPEYEIFVRKAPKDEDEVMDNTDRFPIVFKQKVTGDQFSLEDKDFFEPGFQYIFELKASAPDDALYFRAKGLSVPVFIELK